MYPRRGSNQAGSRSLATACALACAWIVAGCTGTKPSESALRVTVTVAEGVKATCVAVYVKPDGGDEQPGKVIALDGRTELTVAIFRSNTLAGTVEVGARGYVGDCGAAELPLNEESDPVEATFVDGEIVPVAVSLEKVPVAFDADEDGWRAIAAKGLDCDDGAATAYPGATELCDDVIDNDCNGLADCGEAACAGVACEDGQACTTGEVCTDGTCGGGAAVSCEVAPNECSVAPGICEEEKGGCVYTVRVGEACAGGTCRQDGACVDQTIEAVCTDGVDNDTNGKIDCADPDCDQQPCDDGDLCTDDSVCTAGACTSTPKQCTQTTDECREPTGACVPADGSCTFAPKPPNTPCSNGECQADGTCGKSETGAECGNGVDDDGDGLTDCADPSCLDQSCDGLDLCFMGRTCNAAGACVGGSPVSCAQPTACHAFDGCLPAKGCSYSVTTGAACPGGFCSASGTCDPPFPYTPSNFNPADFPPTARGGSYTFNCGTSIFDSTPNATTPFQNWCGQTPPVPVTISQSNGLDAVVLPVNGLTVSGNNALVVVGTRPVILAVFGDATIAGDLAADATNDQPGAGGGQVCSVGGGKPGNTTNGTNGRGGGGSGGSFGSVGGAGGAGYDGTAGGTASSTIMNLTLSPLRGGCSGGAGGKSGGAGGAGGGGVQLSASGVVDVTGRVHARGGGGRGAVQSAGGGGGGGSGGGVLIEGATVSFGGSAIVSANGGGGGEAKGPTGPGTYDGADGDDGYYLSAFAAWGGDGFQCRGGPGGDGAYAGTTAAEAGGQGGSCVGASGGGGGGGGGVGRIRVNAANGCTISSGASFRAAVSSSGTNCP